ncbi:transmembrane protein 97 [Lichtheimia corymbifera JMRC:FSU:9682]|uniref:Efficient mitochondria targeting-associated protein 19 n=1 Tax=Lichtheimia corymbifera JMRC:FSU:9682 TaxID=1263082 RepID=A0A068SFJ5_9FUNG|nr:transmembrane protein 97 [Lichtheimia corymbifera JMRC:FSU:9682]
MVNQTPKSLLARPLDMVYFGYFAMHVPVTVLVDMQPFYPQHLIPQALKEVVTGYAETYKDPLVASPVLLPWFESFLYCEILLQLPFFFIALYGLWKDAQFVRLPLLVYGTHVATTVIPCLAELFFGSSSLTFDERLTISGFYFPYFIIPLVILIDSYCRVSAALSTKSTLKKE